jgi:tetratricopeptide (TPR) repeat protein
MVFRRSKRAFHSVAVAILGLFAFCSFAADLHPYPTPTLDQAREWYGLAKTNYLINTGNTTSAWKFAEACFEWAEFARDSDQRAALAHEGIAAAKFAAEMAPNDAPGHFYLAMNKGQLARTKSIGALSLVKEMESSLLRSIKLDAKFDNAAAERSLGLLYLNAPGWPASIGSKSKARKHLERAVELAPDYPTNLLTLMDAYVHWEDAEALHTAMNRYRKLIPVAKEKYKGALWENSWKDWEERWAKIRQKSQSL